MPMGFLTATPIRFRWSEQRISLEQSPPTTAWPIDLAASGSTARRRIWSPVLKVYERVVCIDHVLCEPTSCPVSLHTGSGVQGICSGGKPNGCGVIRPKVGKHEVAQSYN